MSATLPLEPLLERVAWQIGIDLEGLSVRQVADAVGMQPRSIQRWKENGGVPVGTCDRVAIALGWHPCVIWPEWLG